MDKKQIRKQFLLEVKENIVVAQRNLADNPKFDHLYEFCTQVRDKAYCFLFPLQQGYQGIRAIADLYGSFSYHIEDDGGLILVHAKAMHKATLGGEEMEYEVIEQFVMQGDPLEMHHESVLGWTVYHCSMANGSPKQKDNNRLVGYHACRFNWDTVAFLHSKIPDYIAEKAISEAGSDQSTWDEAELKYEEALKKNADDVLRFIKAQPSLVSFGET